VPIHNLMEDAATAEISRSQLWQWARHGAATLEGRRVTAGWALELLADEAARVRAALGEQRATASKLDLAARLLAGTIQARCRPRGARGARGRGLAGGGARGDKGANGPPSHATPPTHTSSILLAGGGLCALPNGPLLPPHRLDAGRHG
jgi:hypothetical protein